MGWLEGSVLVRVNGQLLRVPLGLTVIKALEVVGVVLMRYCYSERLRVSGNCRSCLVEVEGQSKVGLGCVEVVREGMSLFIDSSFVSKRKEGVLEFLLRNHPLDCPVCDQGGECDLQEGSGLVGSGRGRMFEDYRREVVRRGFSSKVVDFMRRCILCSRCARYDSRGDVGLSLGLLGRSEGSSVSCYSAGSRGSSLVGNVIDLCPVGLLR